MSETVEPGKWYFHVICHSCERAISLMEDPSQGTEVWESTRPETLRCPHCDTPATYQPDEIRTAPGQYRH